jgi:hypothetical protein
VGRSSREEEWEKQSSGGQWIEAVEESSWVIGEMKSAMMEEQEQRRAGRTIADDVSK